MSKYFLTKKAVRDLTDIWNYTYETWSENQADKYYKQILNHCELLAHKAQQGKTYYKVFEGLRGSKINKHIVFYRIVAVDHIEIERVLHQQMDLKSRLKE